MLIFCVLSHLLSNENIIQSTKAVGILERGKVIFIFSASSVSLHGDFWLFTCIGIYDFDIFVLAKEERVDRAQIKDTLCTLLLLQTLSLHTSSLKIRNCGRLPGWFEKVGGTVQRNTQPCDGVCICTWTPCLRTMTYSICLPWHYFP